MAKFKQTDPRSQKGRKRTASADPAGLIVPSDSDDYAGAPSNPPPPTLLTPRPSTTTATPDNTKISTTTTTRRNPPDYLAQKHYDRQSIKQHVTAAIQKQLSQFQAWSATQRWAFVQRERFGKLRERERGAKGARGSARGRFPGVYEEGVE
ncbi:hypothetical protein M409DRAFT_29422, partial [Zasmidium cellare ATCC 36951]